MHKLPLPPSGNIQQTTFDDNFLIFLFFFFFPENRHCQGSRKSQKYFKISSAETFTQTAMALSNNILLDVWITIPCHLDRLGVHKHS